MLRLERTNSKNENFNALVALLDADLGARDGKEHDFYHQFNTIKNLNHAIVFYTNNKAIGCGAIKILDSNTVEIKRMYVIISARGKGYATQILIALEKWAAELGHTRCILETGKRQPEAIALYKKNGYSKIPNYDQYKGIENSVCFEKLI